MHQWGYVHYMCLYIFLRIAFEANISTGILCIDYMDFRMFRIRQAHNFRSAFYPLPLHCLRTFAPHFTRYYAHIVRVRVSSRLLVSVAPCACHLYRTFSNIDVTGVDAKVYCRLFWHDFPHCFILSFVNNASNYWCTTNVVCQYRIQYTDRINPWSLICQRLCVFRCHS